ncbi:MAG: hypothetical protein AB8B53_02620 [Flavobacteriales bacterium]
MTQQVPALINAQELNTLSFPKKELVTTLVSKFQISSLLQTASIIGCRYQDKVKITFSDSEGLKTVEATVWEAGLDKIELKEGYTIPTNRIIKVEV